MLIPTIAAGDYCFRWAKDWSKKWTDPMYSKLQTGGKSKKQ